MLAAGVLALPLARPRAVSAQTATSADTLAALRLLRLPAESIAADPQGYQAAVRHISPALVPWLETRLLARAAHRWEAGAAAGMLVLMGPLAAPAVRRLLLLPATREYVWSALRDVPATDAEALAVLDPLLADADSAVRLAAVQALDGYREGSDLLGARLVAALADPVRAIRRAATDDVVRVRRPDLRRQALAPLRRMLASSDRDERRDAVYALGNLHVTHDEMVRAIAALAGADPDTEIRWLAVRALGWLGNDAAPAVPRLHTIASHRERAVRVEVLAALGGIGVEALTPAQATAVLALLRQRLGGRARDERLAAVRALVGLGAPAVTVLRPATRSPDDSVAAIALDGLAAQAERTEVQRPVLAALGDRRGLVRRAATRAAASLGPAVRATLQDWSRTARGARRTAARRALAMGAEAEQLPIAGRCFALEYGVWTPPRTSETKEGVRPPRQLRLTRLVLSEPVAARHGTLFGVQQRFGGAWDFTGDWRVLPGADSVVIDADPSLSGFRLTLASSGEGLAGEARAYWDFDHPIERAPVRADPIPCTAD